MASNYDDVLSGDERSEIAKKALASTTGAAIGLAVAGPAGVVVGAVAPPLLEAVLTRKNRLGVRNAEEFTSAVLSLTGITPEGLEDWCADEETRVHLVVSAYRAAYWAAARQKILALARIVADAIADDAKLDMSQLLVDVLSELDPPHIRLLDSMLHETPAEHPDGEKIAAGAWSEYQLGVSHPGLANGILPLMARLDRVGMVHAGVYASRLGRCWSLTPFGKVCCDYLRDQGTGVDPIPIRRGCWCRTRTAGLRAQPP